MIFKSRNKKAQIWVETVIYTLIAFIMIGLVLTFVIPKVQEMQDRIIIDKSIEILEDIDNVISTIGIQGNKRLVEVSIKKGELNIDGQNDKLYFEIDSGYQYSEFGENITYGNILINTESENSLTKINLALNYLDRYNITFNNKDELKKISKSSTPHKLTITNNGGGIIVINFELN